jgi:putative peptide zinc metalloprotease protein
MIINARTELPVLSPHLQIGPAEYIGGRVIWQAKHKVTKVYFRLGEREHFLLSRLDGEHTAEDIAGEYSQAFGQILRRESINNALQLFEKRNLLDDGSAAPAAPRVGNGFQIAADKEDTGSFSGKLFHWDPDPFIGAVAPRLKWLINGPVFTLWLLCAIGIEVVVGLHVKELAADSLQTKSWLARGLCFYAISMLVAAAHELAHAIVCKRYGGEVREVGFLFRYFTIFAYTCLDDMMLFQKRLHRVYVALAGPLLNLTLIPIALVVWRTSAPQTLVHACASDILVFFNLGIVMQFIPFLQFDGYYVLAQFMRMPDLRKDSLRFWVGAILHRLNGKTKPMQIAPSCPRYVTQAYAVYGILSALATAAGLVYMFSQYLHWTAKLVGWIPALIAIGVLIGFIATRFFMKSLPQLLKTYAQADAGSPAAVPVR